MFLSCSGQERTDEWSSAIVPDEVTASEKLEDVWRPIISPGEVTVTDVTLNSLTVTFRESRVAKGFFRDWGLEVWIVMKSDYVGGEATARGTWRLWLHHSVWMVVEGLGWCFHSLSVTSHFALPLASYFQPSQWYVYMHRVTWIHAKLQLMLYLGWAVHCFKGWTELPWIIGVCDSYNWLWLLFQNKQCNHRLWRTQC